MIRGPATFLVAVAFVLATAGAVFARQDHPKLEVLFDILQTTDDPKEALGASHLIWNLWSRSESPTTDLMFTRGAKALAEGQLNAALTRFTAVIELDPKFAEGWNKRATVLYMMGDYQGSLNDVYRTLELEPRHFGALSGMGMIFIALDKPKKALGAFRRALAANPHLRGTREQIKFLKKKIEGERT